MNVVTEVSVFNVGMFNFAMGLHVVATREFLATYRTFMALGPMDVGMMPSIRYSLMATDATIQRWKCPIQLNKQR